jgi:glycerophosphoryl diester phosphodiesterase
MARNGSLAPIGRDPRVIAHRGYSGRAPENTLVAFREALELGVDAIECDVRRTLDGEIVLLHDATVDRTTDGSGEVAEMRFDDLRALDAGSWKHERYTGERVPTLSEAIAAIGSRATFIIEIKQTGIEDHVVELIRQEGAVHDVLIFAFDHAVAKRVRELEPRIPCAFLTGGTEDHSEDAARELIDLALTANASMLASHHGGVTGAVLRRVRAAGLTLCVWTIDDPPTMRRWIDVGADWIGTNRPDLLIELLAGHGAS